MSPPCPCLPLALVLATGAVGCAETTSKSEPDARQGYDFIIVGAGAAGAPLAARLADAGKRVLVLEAGTDVGDQLRYQVPAMHALATEDPALAWWYFVRHHADPSLDAEDSKWTEEGILYPRGSGLGGSAAVNAMVTVLPSPNDWNRLATLTGDAGFRATAMERHYASVLEWLSVELPDATLTAGDDVVQSFLAGAVATHREVDLGMPLSPAELAGTLGSLNGLLAGNVNDTLISAEATGVFRLPLATKAGHRFGPRERLIAARRDNLEIRTGAFVTRVIWDFDHDPPRARGVAYVQQESVYGASLAPQAVAVEEQEAVTEGEVILSAGAFNSPQLLMLSGVGDPVALAQLGITPVIEAPAVGHNLQDRYEAAVVTEVSRPLQVLAGCRLDEPGSDDPCLADWEEGRGVYTTPGFLATLLTKSPGSALANLQIFAAPTDARGYYPGYALDAASYRDRFTWLILEGHTHNRDGVVELRDASPFARPSITFNSYDEAAPLADPDLRAMVHGVHVVRKIREQAASLLPEATTLSEIWPGATVPEDDDDALAAWIRRESWGHHACCTNPIGADGDPNAVLDARFRVRGAVGLRVVDASVFPEIPGTFIALPTYMIAEKAAQTLLEDTP